MKITERNIFCSSFYCVPAAGKRVFPSGNSNHPIEAIDSRKMVTEEWKKFSKLHTQLYLYLLSSILSHFTWIYPSQYLLLCLSIRSSLFFFKLNFHFRGKQTPLSRNENKPEEYEVHLHTHS